MKFGPITAADAAGAYAAHRIRLDKGTIAKGTRLTDEHVAALARSGIAEIIAARLEADDVHEDEAAERLARAVTGAGIRIEPPFTGRANLYAEEAGVLVVDKALVDEANRVDPALTFATLPAFARVEAGRMVATAKTIPFAAPADRLEAAEALLKGRSAIRVAPFRPMKVGVVATTLPAVKTTVLDKTRRILDERLADTGAAVGREMRVPHETTVTAEALRTLVKEGHDLLLIFGASAVVDAEDVVPAAITAAGGQVRHLGMPVDPGNLLVLGEIDGRPVIGAPGCARSPKENGFDWILNRLLAGLEVTPEDITGLGVGGLLMEILSRPQPREGQDGDRKPVIGALVLAAGQSRRTGGPNKLLAEIDGKPLVRIVAEAATASQASPVVLVTGHMARQVEAAISGLTVKKVRNRDFAEGLSTSLRTGLASLPADIDAVVVLLADMPFVTPETIDRLIEAFDPEAGKLIVVPTYDGKRGNPVLWSRRYFEALAEIKGDTGGRHLIGSETDAVAEVEIGRSVSLDLDTREALEGAGARITE